MRKIALSIVSALLLMGGFADITVSDVEVFSGYPWKEVVVGYTITGTASDLVDIELNATDKAANKTYTAMSLDGTETTEGRHVLRWNAASDGVNFSSASVVFKVSVVDGYVQLWANGPYWAKRNVGAMRPEEFGYYFWWGDTAGYKRNANNNGWVSVKTGSSFSFSSDNCPTDGKDNSALKSAGYIDSTGNLVVKYDAATAHLGAPWRMPTAAEWNALIGNCTTTRMTRNGVSGWLVAGRGSYASKNIFLPAAGVGAGEDRNVTNVCYYWSSTSTSGSYDNICAKAILTFSAFELWENVRRSGGVPVRPIRDFVQ